MRRTKVMDEEEMGRQPTTDKEPDLSGPDAPREKTHPWPPPSGASENVPQRPSAFSQATDLIEQAMACNAERMQEIIEAMPPDDRDHILASLGRATGMLAKKIREDW